ncbi:hypothetical protein J4441_05440 [Candidatus Micrarchaeota archaeon]|nr:hypothetical protein [Candidatus Micrarchaeota archaeon]
MMHIIFSKDNVASANIADKLLKRHSFSKIKEGTWQGQAGEKGVQLVQFSGSIVEISPQFPSDLLIYASTHPPMLHSARAGKLGQCGFGRPPQHA